jgi:hypothetical protein
VSANAHSEVPKDLELYEQPVILEPYPQLDALNQHRGGVVARPSIPAGQKYEEVTRAYIGAVHSVLTGETPSSVAAAALEKKLVEITSFRTGPPPERDLSSR